MDTNLKMQTTFLAKPLGLLLLVLGLLLTTVMVGYNQISKLRTKIETSNKNLALLEQKEQVLISVTKTLSGDVTFLDVVLPSKGAVLYGINQVKLQAVNNNVSISGIKTGASTLESSGVYKNSVSFEAEGDETAIFNFLESFSTILPLMNVDKVSMNKADSLVQVGVTLSVYSSELPKKLPAVTDSVKDLTKEELAILQDVSTYQMPLFIEPKAETVSEVKQNPFSE